MIAGGQAGTLILL